MGIGIITGGIHPTTIGGAEKQALELAKNLSGNYLLNHVPKNLSPLNVAHNKIIRAINGRANRLSKWIPNAKPKMYAIISI